MILKTLSFATAAACVACLAYAPSPASAQDGPSIERHKVAIRIADLDLASPGGRHRFAARVRAGAREACGYASGGDLASQAPVIDCREAFIRDAAVAAAERTGVASAGPVPSGATG